MKAEKTLNILHECEQASEITFAVNGPTERKLRAFLAYAQMLDYVLDDDEKLSPDGCINLLLDSALDAEIKKISKRFGYNPAEFIDKMCESKDGESAHDAIVEGQLVVYKTEHQKILSHIPVPSDQMILPFNDK